MNNLSGKALTEKGRFFWFGVLFRSNPSKTTCLPHILWEYQGYHALGNHHLISCRFLVCRIHCVLEVPGRMNLVFRPLALERRLNLRSLRSMRLNC